MSTPCAKAARNSASESVVPERWWYRSSGIIASTRRLMAQNWPIWPLCMNINRPTVNGWQLARAMAGPVEARTWAKNSDAFTWWHRLRRFSSDQAGRTSR